jgi:hypothetical protein
MPEKLNKRAIVLGNGPSMRGFDFGHFKGHHVFGMNAAYRYWDEINWYPEYYSCLDMVVGMSHKSEIRRLIENAHIYGIKAFLLRDNLIKTFGENLKNINRVVSFESLLKKNKVLRVNPITTGSHTTIWAMILGYKEIFLMGIDCNYTEQVEGSQPVGEIVLEITSEKDNPNYFFDGYQKIGDQYHIPNPDGSTHKDSWRGVASVTKRMGVKVLNANLSSKVGAFEFCEVDDVLRGEKVKEIARAKIFGNEDSAGLRGSDQKKYRRPFYADLADKLDVAHPQLFRFGQRIMKWLRKIKGGRQ